MDGEQAIRISHVLFDFIEWEDYSKNQNLPVSSVQKLRNVFIYAIWNNSDCDLQLFCDDVMRLQQYRYKLNGTAGVETQEWIPELLKDQFFSIPFIEDERVRTLVKHKLNHNDPGIVLQDCLLSGDLQKSLSNTICQMNEAQFIYFSKMIDSLEWFADAQSLFWFTYYPQSIPEKLKYHFWFIDDNYLGEKDFAIKESRSVLKEKAFY